MLLEANAGFLPSSARVSRLLQLRRPQSPVAALGISSPTGHGLKVIDTGTMKPVPKPSRLCLSSRATKLPMTTRGTEEDKPIRPDRDSSSSPALMWLQPFVQLSGSGNEASCNQSLPLSSRASFVFMLLCPSIPSFTLLSTRLHPLKFLAFYFFPFRCAGCWELHFLPVYVLLAFSGLCSETAPIATPATHSRPAHVRNH
ncbi:hypothetical protein B0T22DRAFT_144320 [Podospora appendiculata]|uniref:Uncharacterized protein n=1 Tax=Podospora appendiculata TaxID=314037 RepID=A0AAE1CC42_9PEZI|nr:hypothetical protein B0T22DRAFT_144320 [Podospora appendiculata]